MRKKTPMSPKNKKIMVGVGVGLGTLLVFLTSFVMAFSLIVNPINFTSVGSTGAVKENEQLKEKVQTLEDQVDSLNATVDKYKNSSASNTKPSTPAITDGGKTRSTAGNTQNTDSGKTETPEINRNDKPTKTEENSETSHEQFVPETSTSTGQVTPEDVDSPVTVIDVSEK